MSRLFLLDGMALVYRAHFAFIRNPIRNSKGVNTSALYGFTNTLLSILENENPSHIGVAFDTSAPTPRHKKYPAYKAQRDEMPEELRTAIPEVKKLCKAFKIPIIEQDGYEADDLIGTLAKQAEQAKMTTFMVTSDKDFAQLVSPNIFMWRPGRKGNDHEIIGPDDLEHVWGVKTPEQIIDLLGMMGDSSDNIPGIPGVGPKTAQKFIQKYGSLEELLAHTDELKGKQKENVVTYADQARLSKDLATIIIDAPIELDRESLKLTERDDDAVKEIFNHHEFRTLTKRLYGENVVTEEGETPTLPETFDNIESVKPDYQIVDSEEKLERLIKYLSVHKFYCFDIETTSLNTFEAELLGIAFAWETGKAWYLPYPKNEAEQKKIHSVLKQIFTTKALKIGHNLKYDLSVLANHDLPVDGPFFDTMLVDALCAPERRHSMDYLAEALLNYQTLKLKDLAEPITQEEEPPADDLFSMAAKKSKKSHKKGDLNMAALAPETLGEYAAEDADVTLQLYYKLLPLLEETQQLSVYEDIEAPLLPVLVAMEREGIALDQEILKSIGSSLEKKLATITEKIIEHSGEDFNLNSPKQLGEILFDKLQLAKKPKKTRTGQYKTDEKTLLSLSGTHPIIEEILEYRELSKLKSTYVDALPEHIEPTTGRIHTNFHQLLTATGRLASSDPNIQNIPVRSETGREIRQAFIAREGFQLLSCDYSQIELRIMAALSGDAQMIADFKAGKDIHTATAARVFDVPEEEIDSNQRRQAKTVNFGIIYGISAFGLSQRLGIPRTEAAKLIENYFREYPAIKKFMDATINCAREHGYAETLTGRRRPFPLLNSPNATIRSNAERAAINTPIQGTAADMIKIAMIRVAQHLQEQRAASKLLLQIHDELIFDLHPDERKELIPSVVSIMEQAFPLPNDVPVRVDYGVGKNWLEAH